VHDNPEPTEEEEELAVTKRQEDEDSMRYPGHEDPDTSAGRTERDEE
jgi:hypothetical protein